MLTAPNSTKVEVPGWLRDPLSAAIAGRDRNVIAMVRNAVETRNVVLAYQPVVRADTDGAVAFHEGLLRVLDGTGRVIPASDFIGAVEQTELGRQLDCLALRIGLETLADQPQVRLSINMSARSIGYPPWRTALKRGLSDDPAIGERLILEITEGSAMLVPDMVQVFMSEMQDRGISFALDDFGSGYTSFRCLRDFLFDVIKIDGQFIRGIASSPDNQVLTEALISIARHFEMFTVAESVEQAADAEFLAGIGIDCMQGYFFGAPTLHPPWNVEDQHAAG